MASGSSQQPFHTVKVGPNGAEIRILGKRKETTAERQAMATSSDAEKFYSHLSRIRAEPDKADKRRKDALSSPSHPARRGQGEMVGALTEQREEKVRERLAERGECDLVNLTCHINSCYRGFESVRVLAWHMSYSHTDESEKLDEPWTCLVCGRVMSSVKLKGKNSHLATGHRDLCVLHNAQCIQQRVPNTKPLVPKRERGEDEDASNAIVKRFLLNDELVYDEDSDFEEDVSVPEGIDVWPLRRSVPVRPVPKSSQLIPRNRRHEGVGKWVGCREVGRRVLAKGPPVLLRSAAALDRPVCSRVVESTECRRWFFGLPKFTPPSTKGQSRNLKSYAERRYLGYNADQMFTVVADVARYKEFVPWCTDSLVHHRSGGTMTAELEIGFSPLTERYASTVTLIRPTLVRSVSTDTTVFRALSTEWHFGPGLPANPNSSSLFYTVSFEFKSALHSHLAHIFFDKVVKTMVGAFLERAKVLYGPASLTPDQMKPRIVSYKA